MKLQYPIFQLIITCLLLSCTLHAQQPLPTNNDIKLSIKSQETNGVLSIAGQINNLSSISYALNYKLAIVRMNENITRHKQQNSFVLPANEAVTFSSIDINISGKDIIEIKFEVYSDTTLISFIEASNELEKTPISTGLIIDMTKTRNGASFFELFNKRWMALELETNVMIRIEEKPLQRRSTQGLIYINDNLVMQQRLLGRYDQIEQQAEYAFMIVLDYFQRNPTLNKETDEEDMQGNGIY